MNPNVILLNATLSNIAYESIDPCAAMAFDNPSRQSHSWVKSPSIAGVQFHPTWWRRGPFANSWTSTTSISKVAISLFNVNNLASRGFDNIKHVKIFISKNKEISLLPYIISSKSHQKGEKPKLTKEERKTCHANLEAKIVTESHEPYNSQKRVG